MEVIEIREDYELNVKVELKHLSAGNGEHSTANSENLRTLGNVFVIIDGW